MASTLLALFRRLAVEDHGQDLVEYALLTGFVALATVASLNAIESSMQATYVSWNREVLACWQMPAPGAGGC